MFFSRYKTAQEAWNNVRGANGRTTQSHLFTLAREYPREDTDEQMMYLARAFIAFFEAQPCPALPKNAPEAVRPRYEYAAWRYDFHLNHARACMESADMEPIVIAATIAADYADAYSIQQGFLEYVKVYGAPHPGLLCEPLEAAAEAAVKAQRTAYAQADDDVCAMIRAHIRPAF